MAVTRTRSLGNTNIFDGLSHDQGRAKLLEAGKTWLLRTSKTPGMLSFDYQLPGENRNPTFRAIRFCYLGVQRGEHAWEIISDDDLRASRFMQLLNKVMIKVDAHLAETIQQDLLNYVKSAHLNRQGLMDGDQLTPPRPTSTLGRVSMLNQTQRNNLINTVEMSIDSDASTQSLSQ
jgi:hypothetical protein